MATIKERRDQNGKPRFQAIIRLKGQPTQTATFGRITDAKKWIQQTESAIHSRSTCRMHGGKSRGPKTKAGKEYSRQAALKHGGHTKEAKAQHREVMSLIRNSKNLFKNV